MMREGLEEGKLKVEGRSMGPRTAGVWAVPSPGALEGECPDQVKP